MRIPVWKILSFGAVAVVLFLIGWQIGYFQGVVDGKVSVYNTRYREQVPIARQIIKDDPMLSNLTIERHGDGNVILKGEVDQQTVERLEAELAKRIGTSRARLATTEIDVSRD